MAGVIHGWAMISSSEEPIPTPDMMITYEEVLWALQQPNPSEVVKSLMVIGSKGETSAATHGYGEVVASLMDSDNPEVAIAAIGAVGKMGQAGVEFAPRISDHLGGASGISSAAAAALGNFGKQASAYSSQLMSLAKESQDKSVKSAAVFALGSVGTRGEKDLIAMFLDMLNASSPQVVAAACHALGRVGDESNAAAIAAKLKDDQTKHAALCGLCYLEGNVVSKFVNEIISVCLTDNDIPTRQLAIKTLGSIDSGDRSNVLDKLKPLLQNQDAGVRCAAAQTLGHMGREAENLVSSLVPLLSDEAEDTSWRCLQIGGGAQRPPAVLRKPMCAALSAMGMAGAEQCVADIGNKLDDDNWEVRVCALEALGFLGNASLGESEKIAEKLKDDVYMVRAKACEVLAQIHDEENVASLTPMLQDKSPSVRLAAVKALGILGDSGAPYSHEVFKLISDATISVRAAAIGTLGCMGERGQCYASVIAAQLNDVHPEVRAASVEALGKMGEYGSAFVDELGLCLEDSCPLVRAAAMKAMEGMAAEAEPFALQLQALADDPFIVQR